MRQHILYFIKGFIPVILLLNSYGQRNDINNIWQKAARIDKDNHLTDINKLQAFYTLKKDAENYKLNDSAYAIVLLKIGKYEFEVNKDYQASINLTINALQINNSSVKGSSKLLSTYCYYNLASYYQVLMVYKKAIEYYDTVISLCKGVIDTNQLVIGSYYNKTDVYIMEGDYQKAFEESLKGINLSKEKDPSNYVYFLNRKAQSLYFINNLRQALTDAQAAIPIAQKIMDQFELATAYKTLGLIYEKNKDYQLANIFFKKSVTARITTGYFKEIATDYVDWGNLYLNSLHDYTKAKNCYYKSIDYANKVKDPIERSLEISLANVNLGENSFKQNNLTEAAAFYLESLNNLKINLHGQINANPLTSQLSIIEIKELVIGIMNDKTQLLLQLFKNTQQSAYLNACIQTAIVTDSVITQIRHEQLGQQSKLYWRTKTRELYTNAMEACYLARDSKLAFFFMEKSRAVLLNDQLNELGATVHLPPGEAAKEENFKIDIIEQQQNISSLHDTSGKFTEFQNKLLQVKEDFEHYIKSLEQKYPSYYQYKYADSVPSLKTLQQYLAVGKQSFVHYFINDTVSYILGITPYNTKLIKLSKKDFNPEELTSFLQLCADKEKLNSHFNTFMEISCSIYKTLFQPLQLPKGRVVICADNFLIPFETLCAAADSKHFLVYDYAFSYVYSARYLMNKFDSYPAKGDFLGIAPVSFAPYLNVINLSQSAVALTASASYYRNVQILTNSKASKNNFLQELPRYTVVNIFSHAYADTTDNEPLLFMADSVIHLSELQLINNPATKLVMLSACQTNVGKNAKGEGFYTLARGFAYVGIPSVSATLWKADEETIYTISKIFNRNISLGMHKDEALQQAKLSFMQKNNGNKDKLLSFYWANMILVGNTDPLELSAHRHYGWVIAIPFLLLSTLVFFYRKKMPVKKI